MTTRGRKSGLPREIEIWFAFHDGDFFVIAEHATSNWLKNLQADPSVQVRIRQNTFRAQAKVLSPESRLAATVSGLFRKKYVWGDGVVVQLSPQISAIK